MPGLELLSIESIAKDFEVSNLLLEATTLGHLNYPIINSVLNGTQKGFIYRDNDSDPQFLIIHKSGFSQIIKKSGKNSKQIVDFLVTGDWPTKKIRLYSDTESNTYEVFKETSYMKTRSRLMLNVDRFNDVKFGTKPDITVRGCDTKDEFRVNEFEGYMAFWSSWSELCAKGTPFGRIQNGRFTSICYSAALFGENSEIDIYTNIDSRRENNAKKVAIEYISQVLSINVFPIWDAYCDNVSSLKLAQKLGFEEVYRYPMYIFTSETVRKLTQ